jgi:hypothetical protein
MQNNMEEISGKMRLWIATIAILGPIILSQIIKSFL